MKLLGWGANSYGQLGLGYKNEQILVPEEIIFCPEDQYITENILSISGGAGHTIILDKDGFLYSCGWNSKGQLGLQSETLKFTKIEALSDHKIVQVACGWDFNTALTDKGKVFVWGSNDFLQIGLPKSVKYIFTPTLLDIENIKYVSCGVRHMVLTTCEGEVLVCGNGNKGQLGIIDDTNKIIRETNLHKIPQLSDIINVACGQHHTLALKADGTVYGWGNNKHGQLGIDPAMQETIPTPLKLNFETPIDKVFTGWTHSAVLTKSGEIFNFGRNTYGQLGAERKYNWIPTKLESVSISHLNLGSEHNLAVTFDRKLLCWGWNEHGNCGSGDTADLKLPEEIMSKNVFYAAAGTGQSFAIVQRC